QQRNWIGRSEGALIRFPVICAGGHYEVPVYTTRPETLFGTTYLVLAPEHPLIGEILAALPNAAAVKTYRELAAHRSDFERTESPADAGKTGVPLAGVYAENPATGERIPVWIGDYVLAGYGTGAVMAVPAHDDRDFAFARAHGLPARTVITGGVYQDVAYTDETAGTLVGSGIISGLGIAEARSVIIQEMTNRGYGRAEVRYRLRDWVFSRQRYWGEPIPLAECPVCGWVPVDEADLPVLLPEIESYRTSPDGESPLAGMSGWVNIPCPRCGGPARRETDTMPQWAGSSWYFLRYTDPHNSNRFADPEKLRYWLPVDWYNGGMEHTTLHLLYSRFWHLFLSDIGCVPTPEPYTRRTSHGMVLGENGEKMSKSRGNVINLDAMVDQSGADAFRVYEMFMGAFDQAIPWSTRGLGGCRRFLERVWGLRRTIIGEDHIRPDLLHKVHGMIDKVGGDYEKMKFNTAIAAMMSFVNEVIRLGGITREELRILLLLLHPAAPHITEELWEQAHLGRKPLHLQAWPVADTRWLSVPTVELAIQVAGRIVARIDLPTGTAAAVIEAQALAHPAVAAALAGRTARRVVVVPDRLVNIVV
ncbi:MAG TPA: leucine--tRNA ligase, partial [Clostridia bacterium]